MENSVNLEAVHGGLRATKLLRGAVRDLFKSLADGSTSVGQQNNNDGVEGAEKAFVSDLQSAIGNINVRIRELESACTLLAAPSAPVSGSLGNSVMIGQDPAWERTPIYMSMVNTYRWSDRMTEYAACASSNLNQNSLKRAALNPYAPGRNRNIPPSILLNRRTTHTVEQVNNICIYLTRNFQDMNVQLERPFGSPAVLKITLERVLKAVVLLRGAVIEWVLVKGYNEDFLGEDGKIDIWSSSRYEVFRKVTDHANAAMLHFYSPIHADLALKSFVVSRCATRSNSRDQNEKRCFELPQTRRTKAC